MTFTNGQFDMNRCIAQEWDYGKPIDWCPTWPFMQARNYTPEPQQIGYLKQIHNYITSYPQQAMVYGLILVVLGYIIVKEAFEI